MYGSLPPANAAANCFRSLQVSTSPTVPLRPKTGCQRDKHSPKVAGLSAYSSMIVKPEKS